MIRPRQIWRYFALAALTLSTGMALAQQIQLPQPQERRGKDDGKPESTVAEIKPQVEGLPASVDPNSYKIGSEDVIKVMVWKEQDLSFVASVRPDGKVTAPLLGELMANGQTPTSFAAVLKEKLSELVNNPLVSVEVLQVRSKKYYITGPGAARTGVFPLVVPTTVLEALTMAGGLSEWADRKKIVIMRGEKRFKFNYDAAIKGKTKKSTDDNILLENGDFVVVN
jgi:polysaccharide biosynthesis/export protein